MMKKRENSYRPRSLWWLKYFVAADTSKMLQVAEIPIVLSTAAYTNFGMSIIPT